jgi:LysR family hydrogen peroxide-inducible transcriptional activator
MDVRQLRALLAVGDHHSFSAAARALHTVQSNVSAHVARLEREMGVTLIDRATLTLTEEGVIVAERARRIDAEFLALASDVASLRDEVHGRVRLGCIGTTAKWLVPPLFRALEDRYPGIAVLYSDATTAVLVPQLITGRIDLAVVNLPVDDPDIVITPLFTEEQILLAPLSHPLSDRHSVTLSDLAEHRLLLEAEGTAYRLALDEAAERAGVSLQALAEFDGMRLLASLAFAGFGAAILPASAAPFAMAENWRRIPVLDLPARGVGLAKRRRGLPSAAERVVAGILPEVIAEHGVDQAGIHPSEPI